MLKELRVGTILKPHGLKGEMKVYPTTEEPRRFTQLKELILRRESQGLLDTSFSESRKIKSVRFQGEFLLLQLEGIDSVEMAEKNRNVSLMIPREQALPLGENEFFLGDYIGMEVYIEGKELLGEVKEVIETGANLVFSVEGKEKEYLIPHIPPVVYEIKDNRIGIHLMEGLLEL